jgi:DNA gyrase/topoisomerase IV subunit A
MLLLFTDQGRCHELMGSQIPITPRRGKSVPIRELFTDLNETERAVAVLSLDTEKIFADEEAIIMLCSNGEIKRLAVNALMKHRGKSCDCFPITAGAKLIGAEYVQPSDLVAIFTKNGYIRCFGAEGVRLTNNRRCGGVMTATPKDDELLRVERVLSNMNGEILVVSSDGFAVRVSLDALPVKKGRHAQGNRLVRLRSADSKVVYAGCVQDGDLVFLTTSALRSAVFDAAEVREVSARGSSGVRVGRLSGDEKIVAAACVKNNIG